MNAEDNNKRKKEMVWYQWYRKSATEYLTALSSGTLTPLRAVPDERYYQLYAFSSKLSINKVKIIKKLAQFN